MFWVSSSSRLPDAAGWMARLALGVIFLRMGLQKAQHPDEFLKLLHAYGVLERFLPLAWIAALLPWFEATCGVLLLLGWRVRGTLPLVAGMLGVFSLLVLQRALALSGATGMPLCAIRFDCGCGNGEVAVCRKLLENGLLLVICGVGFLGRSR